MENLLKIKNFDEYLTDFIIRDAHNSTNINGSTILPNQTIEIVAGNLERYFNPNNDTEELQEYTEVKNYVDLWNLYRSYIKKEAPLFSIDMIKNTYFIITKRIINKSKIKNKKVSFYEEGEMPNSFALSEKEIIDIIDRYNASTKNASFDVIVKEVARFYVSMKNIHPFLEKNGIIARALINLQLCLKGILPLTIPFIENEIHTNILDKCEREYSIHWKEEVHLEELAEYFKEKIKFEEAELAKLQ